MEGIPLIGGAIANVTRLLTGKDKVTYDKSVDLYKNYIENFQYKDINKIGSKLLNPNDPQAVRLGNIFKDLLAPMSINSMNAYQQVLPGVGITLRPGEYGEVSRFSSYFQVQSAGQNISSAVYSLASSTLMKAAVQGRGELGLLVQNAFQRITGGAPLSSLSPGQMKMLANAILGVTASTSSLDRKHKRKYTSPAGDPEANLIGGDNILSHALRERIRRSSELSNQRVESIMSRMSDMNDPNMLMGVVNLVSPNDPYPAVARGASAEDLGLIAGHHGAKSLLNHIFNPLGHTTIKALVFQLSKKSQTVQSNEMAIEDTSEWMQYTSTYLDTSQIEDPNATSVIGKVFQNFDQLVTPLGTPAKFAIYTTLAIATAAPVLGFASSFMFNNETAAVLNSLELPRTLFDTASKSYNSFTIHKSPLSEVNKTRNRLTITRGSARFNVYIPDNVEDINVSTFGKAVLTELNNVQGSIRSITQELETAVFGVPDLIGAESLGRKELITSLDHEYSQLFDKYIDDVFEQFSKQTLGNTGATFAEVAGSGPLVLDQLKHTVKTSTKQQIQAMLKQEIASTDGRLLKRFNLRSEKEAMSYLGYMIHSYTAGLFRELKSRLLILSPEDITSVAKLEQRLAEAIQERGGKVVGSRELIEHVFQGRPSATNTLADGVELGDVRGTEYLSKSEFKGRARAGSLLKGVGSGLFRGFTIASSMFETVDIYSSYSRLAAAADDPIMTDAQTRLMGQHAGSVTTNSLIGLGIGYGISKAPQAVGKVLSKVSPKMTTSKWGLLTVGILGAIAGVTAFGKNIQEMASAVWNSSPVQATTNFLGGAYEGVSKGIGSAVLGTASLIHSITGGLISKGAVISAIGGALTGVSMLLAAGTFVSIGATAGAVALSLGGAAAVGGALGFGLGMIPGFNKFAGSLMGQFTENLAKIPFIGGLWATSMDSVYSFKGNRFEEPGSPIVSSTAQDAIVRDSQRYLLAASDSTGSRSKQLFLNY